MKREKKQEKKKRKSQKVREIRKITKRTEIEKLKKRGKGKNKIKNSKKTRLFPKRQCRAAVSSLPPLPPLQDIGDPCTFSMRDLPVLLLLSTFPQTSPSFYFLLFLFIISTPFFVSWHSRHSSPFSFFFIEIRKARTFKPGGIRESDLVSSSSTLSCHS